ncbi:MAG TPA: EAL domain-containing response regulator [Terracidiphilus sp.]|jgi:EAL domain-containing protein (putative c-di-GMP-specific phosphodiesterase class I)/CheY-like chemotaxis protein|nr:EAL domain-containing response regulator [Terracidiphilus sp.]
MANDHRILVIDDDNTICEVVSALARTLGFDCATTKDAATLTDSISPDIDLILLDLVMPGMDGIEVLRMLGERRCRAQILLMSGVDKRVLETAEKLAHSLGLRVVGHLQKPFPLPDLKGMLEGVAALAVQKTFDPEAPSLEITDNQLRNAIVRREFVNFYQPQIHLATGKATGVEALARWRHPERGLVLPDNFISRIESLGLIDSLCWSTAEPAMDEARKFLDANGECPRLSLNASMYSLHDLEFPDTFVKLARRYDYPIDKIVIEVTESRLAHELTRTLDVLTRLRMKGFQLSIDDFGSGYAMMRQLQNVPATELKIDKSIVENMHVTDSDRVMVEKIIEMGHELGMSVVAEGVMIQAQYDMLRAMGCDGAQGYLISRPLPADAIPQWMAAHEANLKQ